MGLPAPVYEDEWVTFLQGDAIALLPEIPAARVQLILVDPPYFKAKLNYQGTRLEWDRQWPTRDAYLAWLRQLAKEWQRVLAPNGSLYCFAAPTMAAHVEVMLEDYFTVLNHIRWVKDAGWHNKADKEELRSYLSPWEAILFCEQQSSDAMALGESGYAACEQQLLRKLFGEPINKSRQARQLSRQEVSQIVCGSHSGACWNWEDGIRMPTEEHFTKLLQIFPECFDRNYEALRADYETLRAGYEAMRRPFQVTSSVPYTDVWDFATVPTQLGKHPCEKPLPLLRHMIEVSSRPGDLILDCCAGSASTLEAARQCGRKAIGIELESSSCQLGVERLRQMSLW